MTIIDANIVLRYLMDDHEELSSKATEIIEYQSVMLPIEVACEIVYVLQKVYCVEKSKIQEQLSELVNEGLVTLEKLIEIKTEAGRAKDRLMLPLLMKLLKG